MRTLSPLGKMTSERQPGEDDSSSSTSSSSYVLTEKKEVDNGYVEADVMIDGTKCKRCCEEVDLRKEAVNCFRCNKFFHGICYKNQNDIGSPSAMTQHLVPAVSKTGSYERRFGHFIFLCDYCFDQANQGRSFMSPSHNPCPAIGTTIENRVVLLSEEVTTFKEDLTGEIASLKAMVKMLADNSTNQTHADPTNPSTSLQAPNASYSDMLTSSPSSHEQKQQLIHIATENASSLTPEELKEKVTTVKSKLSQSLSDVPTNFVKTNNQKGSVTVAFPDVSTREKGSRIIEDLNLSASGFTSKEGKKMLPKLTIAGVDTSIFDDIDLNLPHTEKRMQQKSVIKRSIINKNDCVKVLTEAGHTLDVVYINFEVNQMTTVAIKVSPAIRSAILQNQQGYIFIGNSSLPIEDRFFFKQCYHCQQVGHFSSDCPKAAESPVCFYCMGPHQSKTCQKKKMKSEHCCSKCFNSNVASEKNDYTSHNAADPKCPVVLREIQKIASNTDIISKNVM